MTRFGVIVPARNEAAGLGETLISLSRQDGVHADVVVVANGCTDDTYEVAASYQPLLEGAGHRLTVLQTEVASKTAALNAGEACVEVFPRAYVDADVRLTPNALCAVASVLQRDAATLAAPRLHFTSSARGRSQRVAGLLEILPPFSTDVVGGGFYAVNAEGRRRWGQFPALIADDAFVCGLFQRSERIRVPEAAFFARFPDDRALQGVLTRWEVGRAELRRLGGKAAPTAWREALGVIIRRPATWRAAAEFLALKLRARSKARTFSPEAAGVWWPRA